MPLFRPLLGLAALAILGSCLAGCGNDPDKTGDGEKGFGPAGTNGTNLPQTPEEQLKEQKQREAEFKKSYKSK